MSETGKTTDEDVLPLMKELSLYGNRHPMSNESRLSMRKKFWSMIVAFGLTAIWFTINPNDINNPVKLKLAAHMDRDGEAARAFLRELTTSLHMTTLAVHDPLSSTVFFFREISLFFEHYVRAGRPSIYGKVSHYYAAMETNDRGALHLHGMLWLDGNLDMANLVRDMANPDEGEYRSKVKSFVDDVFTATLDEALAKEAMDSGKKTTVVESELIHDAEWLSGEFEREANFVASRCQVHHHTATCVKYSIKQVLKAGVEKARAQLCRFRAPWKLVPETSFTEDGLLEIKRDHDMVNQYNQSMAIGLRHNTDISPILTRKKGLALVHYVCNYASKLHSRMWDRLAYAEELLELARQQQGEVDDPGAVSAMGEATKSFLLRVANRIHTSRELSQPEVLGYLLGFETDFTNVPAWAWVHLNSLYWACARQWPGLREALSALGQEPHPENVYFQASGFKHSYVEAYKHRGPVFAHLCFYDYVSFVVLEREHRHQRGPISIPFPPMAIICTGWVQRLRMPHKTAVPILDGRLTDDFDGHDENFVKRYVPWPSWMRGKSLQATYRNAVLHLALFVPWERFQGEPADDVLGLWRSLEGQLGARIRSHVQNIALLRVSADDARADRKLQGLEEEHDDIADADAFGDQAREEDGAGVDVGGIDAEDHYEAFLGVLSAVRGSEIKDMAATSALRRLDEEARAVGPRQDDSTAAQRGRHFYTMLQDLQDSPFRGIGLPSREEPFGTRVPPGIRLRGNSGSATKQETS
jgi:hypothetical protein